MCPTSQLIRTEVESQSKQCGSRHCSLDCQAICFPAESVYHGWAPMLCDLKREKSSRMSFLCLHSLLKLLVMLGSVLSRNTYVSKMLHKKALFKCIISIYININNCHFGKQSSKRKEIGAGKF